MNLQEKLLKILEFAPKEMVDTYARNTLISEAEKYTTRRYRPLSQYEIKIDGKSGDFYDLILKNDFKIVDIIIKEPLLEGVWFYNSPVKKLRILKGGLGFANILIGKIDKYKWMNDEGVKDKVMVRAYITRYYQPQTIKMKSEMINPDPPPLSLRSLDNLIKDVLNFGIVPFEIKLLIYTKAQRFSLLLDLLNSTVVCDPREGVMNPRLFRNRDPMEYVVFDSVIAKIHVPYIARCMFEILFESDGLCLNDIIQILNLPPAVAENNLNVLINKGLVEVDDEEKPPKYYVNINKLKEIS